MHPTCLFRIIGLLLLLNLCSIAQAKNKTGPFALSGGCITTATQYVVNGGLPAAITATVASGGNCTSYSYQWQRSTDNVYFTDIPGATGQNLGFTATLPPTQATWFQRKTTCGNETVYTGSVAVNMIVQFYYNVADTGVFTRTCATGATPQPYTYIVRASKYASPFSQADADAKAQKDLTDSGMYYANLQGVCLWYNVQRSGTYPRTNCGAGTGWSYTYTVPANRYFSPISQVDADAKADKEIVDSGQIYANRLGLCTYPQASMTLATSFTTASYPSPITVNFIKNGTVVQSNTFPNAKVGSVTFNVVAGTYTMQFVAPAASSFSYLLDPAGNVWMKTRNSTTINTGSVTFVTGNSYTITASDAILP